MKKFPKMLEIARQTAKLLSAKVFSQFLWMGGDLGERRQSDDKARDVRRRSVSIERDRETESDRETLNFALRPNNKHHGQ